MSGRFIPELGDWADQAACVGTPMAWWYPIDAHGSARPDHVPAEAAERCATCPVRRECAAHALRSEEWGVWAGTSEEQRRRARRAAGIRIPTAADHLVGGGGTPQPRSQSALT